jgi:hypothetical protein
MRLPRRAVDVPGLARLLADLPRERLATLLDRWGGGSLDGPGIVAVLYRTMSDRERLAAEVGRLDATARLVLSRLADSPHGLNVSELGRRLPFTDESIESALQSLQEAGLAWRVGATDRQSGDIESNWTVARDLAARLAAAARLTLDTVAGPSQVSPFAPPVIRLEAAAVPASGISVGGAARERLSALVSRPAESSSIGSGEATASFARRAGIALGVLQRRGGMVGLGPRAEQWSKLAPIDQTRALTRLWLVDESVSERVQSPVRVQFVRVLTTGEAGVWYEVWSVARVVAGLISEAANPSEISPSSSDSDRPASVVSRSDLVRAIAVLHWIGVVDVAADNRGVTRAIRLTPNGAAALA